MKRLALVLGCALFALSAAAVTATKDYVDRRDAETLAAANAYTDAHSGGGGGLGTNVVADIANYAIATNATVAAKANRSELAGYLPATKTTVEGVDNYLISGVVTANNGLSAPKILTASPSEFRFASDETTLADKFADLYGSAQTSARTEATNAYASATNYAHAAVTGTNDALTARINAQATALTNHTGDNTRHVTAADKSAWDGHIADASIHVTGLEKQSWSAKQDAISDLETIRQNATTAVQPTALTSAISSHNSSTVAHLSLFAAKADADAVYYALGSAVDANTVSYVHPTGGTVSFSVPDAVDGHARDWVVVVDVAADSRITLPSGANFYAPSASVTNAVKANVMTLFTFTEFTTNSFVVGRQDLTRIE